MRDHRKNVERSRELRRKQTEAESILWMNVRDRRLGGYKFRRQHQVGPWIPDLCCPERKIVLEADGGGHDDPDTRARDAERDQWLKDHKWRVLRFWNFEVIFELEVVLEVIRQALQIAPHPDPLPAAQGEGDR
jgi:very-short-patch-repair endonuclease